MGCGSELRSHVPRERSEDCRLPAGRAPRGWAALRGEDHRPPAVRRWENGGGNSRGPRQAGTGAPPAGSSPRTRQGCLCHGARGCGWLPHERAGEDWGWAGVVHRDREGCLHTSLSTSGVQKAGGPGPPDTSSALADSRQIQRPATWSAGADELLVPRGLSAFGLDDITWKTWHAKCTAPSPWGLRDPLSSTLRCPRGCPWTGVGGPWGQGPPPPNPLQAKPIPSSKRSQSLRGQRAVSWVPSSAILSTQGLGLQEDALHGRDPLLVPDVEGLELQAGQDSGVTGHRGPSGAPWVSPSGSSLVQPSLRMDTPGVLSPRLFPGWA